MLKWFGGGGGGSSSHANNNGNGGDNLTHVGKVFIVNEHQVVVEELIAEGKPLWDYYLPCLEHSPYSWRGMIRC